MDFRELKTHHVKGTCACGNTFEGVVPHWVQPTECDSCIFQRQAKIEADRRAAALRTSAAHCGIPAKFWEWDKVKAEEIGSDRVFMWLISDVDYARKSAWLGGTNGIGKTHSALYVCFRMIEMDNVFPYCVRSSSWLRDVVNGRTKSTDDSAKAYRRAIECALFVLDDLGKERLTEPRAELLYDIIDERDRSDRPIWITTNFSGQELIDRLNASGDACHEYGYAILKRLQRMIPADRIWK